MKIQLDIPEELLKPLIERHLATGRSVASLVDDAISMSNKVHKVMADTGAGFAVYVGKKQSGRIYNEVHIYGGENDK